MSDISEEEKRKQEEKERKKAEVRKRLEEASAAKKGKKGFMTPERKKKLRTLLRKKAAEELKKEQERKAEERRKVIHERCGNPKVLDGANEAELQSIVKEYHQRVAVLEATKWDEEFSVRQKDYQINELSTAVNDSRGKFMKPPLKKVSKFNNSKFEKLKKAAKSAELNEKVQLKTVKKPVVEDDSKEEKPEWALGKKKEDAVEA